MQYKPSRKKKGKWRQTDPNPRTKTKTKHRPRTQPNACSYIGPPPDDRKRPRIPWATPPRRSRFTLDSRFCGEGENLDGCSWRSAWPGALRFLLLEPSLSVVMVEHTDFRDRIEAWRLSPGLLAGLLTDMARRAAGAVGGLGSAAPPCCHGLGLFVMRARRRGLFLFSALAAIQSASKRVRMVERVACSDTSSMTDRRVLLLS